MLDTRIIYSNVTLDVYVNNDPVVMREKKLNAIKYEKQRLILEIEDLRNG